MLTVSVYVVVSCGWTMSTKPVLVGQVPIPEIVTETPVPDASVTDQARRTVWLPPIVTVLGVAVNDVIPGAGQAFAVTCVCVAEEAPQPFVTYSV